MGSSHGSAVVASGRLHLHLLLEARPVNRPRLLDLMCGAGGAARGYQLAGFHVTGVDINPQPRYAGDVFVQADAMTFPLAGFDAIHASPPCPRYANVTRWRGKQDDHPDLLPPTRIRLEASGVPWVIENVVGAPMRPDLVLCGSSFGLMVRRHRWFESNVALFSMLHPCRHGRDLLPFMHKNERAYADALGCLWMSSKEARDAVPPAYTEHIGHQLMAHVRCAA